MSNESITQLYTEIKTQYPVLNGRLERAVNLANQYHVRQLSPDVYEVKSANGQHAYVVSFHTMMENMPGWNCSCPDVRNGAPRLDWYGAVDCPTCKHIIAVGLVEMLCPDVISEAATRRLQEIWDAANPADDYSLEPR